MTQIEIDNIKSAKELRHKEIAQIKTQINILKKQKTELDLQDNAIQKANSAICDHTLPNGKTAWQGGFMFSICSICDDCDL